MAIIDSPGIFLTLLKFFKQTITANEENSNIRDYREEVGLLETQLSDINTEKISTSIIQPLSGKDQRQECACMCRYSGLLCREPSSFGAYINGIHINGLFSPNRFLFDIDPDILKRPHEPFDASRDNESVQGRGIDIVVPGIRILYTKKHSFLHDTFVDCKLL